jgi:uncharacterized protein with PIN domain
MEACRCEPPQVVRSSLLLSTFSRRHVPGLCPEEFLPRLPQLYDEFLQCRDCGRAYWRGGHFRRLRQLIDASIQASTVAR